MERRAEGEAARTVIGIPEVREALRQVSLKPYEGSRIVVIFDGVESLSDEAANALLKTLEEPPDQVTFLLLSANEEALLATIRSRCSFLSLLPVPQAQMVAALMEREAVGRGTRRGTGPPVPRLLRLGAGRPAWFPASGKPGYKPSTGSMKFCQSGLEERFAYANELAAQFSKDRDSARQTLFEWLRWWRDLLLIKEGAHQYLRNADRRSDLMLHASALTTAQTAGFLERIHKTLEALDRNANPRLACEVLMLNLPKANPT